ncbi:MAG: PIN domain nuclease, partial [SAR324 cluster bacterium]|nr:PIN domain nuclease [SAR324 cluster bacterium]
MRLLLDTHILLWSLLEPDKLSAQVSEELILETNELWLSPITTWEIMVLAEKKQIILDSEKSSDWIRKVYTQVPFKEAPINHEV